MKERCDNCRFWKSIRVMGDHGEKGLCRRFPPAVIVQETIPRPIMPNTYEGAWCGEWQQKEETK